MARATYNAAADFYDHPANSFWERFGARTVARLGLRAGDRILDACCGSGASAIPAAEAVGPAGSIVAIDIAENLLELGRTKARDRGFRNVEFRAADLLAPASPQEMFDAVICVFGIFFIPDMRAAATALWSKVRPGGRLAITTWGPRFLEPVNTAFWDAVRAERPDLHKGFNPWERIADPAALKALFASADALGADAVAECGFQPVRTPDDWWAMVLGTGYRGTIEQLAPGSRARIETSCANFIRTKAITRVETNVVYGVAVKPR
jgi:2-polyprenyl-3-methyl-5-hydroxy-6-metoxy-1,4-benzoquinol methylase